jgi:deoxyribose-phosphate aldolase
MVRREIAGLIDHTLLKPEATPAGVKQWCEDARRYHFAAVCVNPAYVSLAAKALEGTDVAVCTVVGFPLGATTTEAKVCEARQALLDGATELDMVIHIGALKAGEYERVEEDIAAVTEVAHVGGGKVKVIIETALLNEEEKISACRLAKAANANFVKTSTGFAASGAKVEDVRLMRKTVGTEMGVKAAGGIHSYQEAMAMIEAGATRIGASAGVRIVEQAPTG